MNNRGKSKIKLNDELPGLQRIKDKAQKTGEDINQTIRELKNSKLEIKALLETIRGEVAVLNRHGRFLKILKKDNQKILNKNQKELKTRTIFDSLPSKQANSILNKIGKALDSKKAISFKYTIKVNNIKYLFNSVISPLNKNHVILISVDITNKKQNEQPEKKSIRLFKMIWDISADGMRLSDENGIMVMVNKAFCKMVKKKKEDLEGKPISVIYQKSKSLEIIRKHKERFRDRTILPYVENELTLWNNEKIYIGVSNSFFEFEGKIPYTLGIFRNLTERKRDEKQILILAQALKNISECVTITDLNRKIIFINDAFVKTYGYNEDELLGKKIDVVRTTSNDEKLSTLIHNHSLQNGWQGELLNKRKDGTEFTISLSTTSINDGEGKPVALIGVATDITERKAAEQQLKLTLSLLHAALESTADGLLIVNRHGKITGYNQKFLKMWHLPADLIAEGNDEKALDYVNQQLKDPDAFLKQVQYLYNQQEMESYDLLEFKDGRIFERYSLPQKLNEKIVGRVWSFRDVTREKKSEEALIESEKRFRMLFEDSAEAICIMTDKFEECNEQFCNLFECSREDIINHSPWEFSPEIQPDGKSSKKSALEKINAALEDKPQYFYWQHKSKKGNLIDAEVSLNGFVLGGKKLVQATVHNITERKKFEKIQTALYKISESVNTTEDMQTLFTKIHEVIKGLMSADNFYIALYDENTDLLSFPYFVDEADPPPPPRELGKGLTDYVLRTGKEAIIREKEEIELKKNNEIELVGAYSPVWVGVPLKLEGKSIGVMVVQDYQNEFAYTETEKQILVFVSEQIALAINRKKTSEELINYTKRLKENKDLLEQKASQLAKLNEQLEESEKKLKQLNASKDKLFSIVAHDLKGPFQPLLGMSEILANEQYTLNEKERNNFITEIHNLLKNQFKLVDNLLDWAKIQTGRQPFNPVRINLSEKVNEVNTILNANAINKNIKVTNNVESDVFVFADSYMLQSTLQNLISNAIKFTNTNGTISISSIERDNYFEITVADNGVGISDEEKGKIFRIDTQHSTLGTDHEKGTGLGLIICKEMLEKNGGKIWIESEPGVGSKFIFTLPKCQEK